MKFICVGDLHLTTEKPKRRKENYCDLQLEKMEYILNMAKVKGIKYILSPGDIFDDAKKTSHYLVQKYINLFNDYQVHIIGVYGQHDLRYHNPDIDNTPFKVMMSAGVLTLPTENPINLIEDVHVCIYGAGWKQEVPKVKNPSAINILLTHRLIMNNEKLWDKQSEVTWAGSFLETNEFDLIVSGDNHQGFFQKTGNKRLVNHGSLMRSDINQINHQPTCSIYDTDKLESQWYNIDILPSSVVFELKEAVDEKQKNEKLESFVKGLKDENDIKKNLKFIDNVYQYAETNKVEKGVVNILDEVFNGI